MARADLSAMLNRLGPDPAEAPSPTPTTPDTPPPSETEPVAEQAVASDVTPASTGRTSRPSRAPRRPRRPTAAVAVDPAARTSYLALERKETRLRADQYAELTRLARHLSRTKNPGGERITENTLIRVAIDLLLENPDLIAGSTETEIRNSVTS